MFLIFGALITYMYLGALTIEHQEGKAKLLGSFVEDLRLDSPWALLYTPIYLVRRLIFCTLILSLDSNPFAQVIVLIASTGLYLIYLVWVRPFKEPKNNWMAIVNEAFVLVIAGCLLAFVDEVCTDTGK